MGFASRRSGTVLIVAGCLIALVTYGLRTSFGRFTEPLSALRGWDRETSPSRSRCRTSSGGSGSRSRAGSPTATARAGSSPWAA